LFAKIFHTLVFILLPLCGANSYAQEVPSEKRDLIRELLVVMDARRNAVVIMDSISDQMQKDMLATLNRQAEGDSSLTAAERAEKQRAVAESARRSGDRFRELFKQRVDYAQLVEEVSYEAYDKHLTVEEMRYLLAFYKSETGQKLIRIMPQLISESMSKFSERLTPALQEISQQILDEEMERIKSTQPVERLQPPRKRPAGRTTTMGRGARRRQ